MKPKAYRQNFRRALAEAMLGQGVIVGEGITERDALQSCANTMEEVDTTIFPFDVAGVSVIDAEGEGNLARLGQFFKTIEIPAFAFFDRKRRPEGELEALAAVYDIVSEIPYQGAEDMLVAEVPLDRQWQFLQVLHQQNPDGHYGIPANRPNDEQVKVHTLRLLKGLKGAGGAARLLDLCDATELPPSIQDFLRAVYARFPKPQHRQISLAEVHSGGVPVHADATGEQLAASRANPTGETA
jgi:putative ATP-dependent endonuclease of OLD family